LRAASLFALLLLAASPALAQPAEGADDAAPAAAAPAVPDADAVRRSRFAARPSDAAYGAFQRGYYITALNLATPLALDGDAAAQTLIGEIYSRGLGVRRDLPMAIEWYEKAAEQNVPEALFQLAMILHDGNTEIRDRPRAGHGVAQFNFAQILANDPRADPQTVARAVSYYEKAAQAGLADAQYAMAEVFRQGAAGRPADPAEARRWLGLAAAQNHDTAQIELGAMLVEGEGGERDEKAGFSWLMRAASAGNPAAQNRVAKLYRAGIGVEPDRVEASAWYLRARRAGLVDPLMEDQLDGLTEEELDEARKRAGVLG
jgi:TPR repeat protein